MTQDSNTTGLTHQLLLPDTSEEGAAANAPLHVALNFDDKQVSLQIEDADGLYACDLLVEHRDGQAVLYVSTAEDPDQHRYRIVLGRAVRGGLEPYEPEWNERRELEVDHGT